MHCPCRRAMCSGMDMRPDVGVARVQCHKPRHDRLTPACDAVLQPMTTFIANFSGAGATYMTERKRCKQINQPALHRITLDQHDCIGLCAADGRLLICGGRFPPIPS